MKGAGKIEVANQTVALILISGQIFTPKRSLIQQQPSIRLLLLDPALKIASHDGEWYPLDANNTRDPWKGVVKCVNNVLLRSRRAKSKLVQVSAQVWDVTGAKQESCREL